LWFEASLLEIADKVDFFELLSWFSLALVLPAGFMLDLLMVFLLWGPQWPLSLTAQNGAEI